MCKIRPGSGHLLDLPGKTNENQGKTRKARRNPGSKFLRAYFLSIFLLDFLAVALVVSEEISQVIIGKLFRFPAYGGVPNFQDISKKFPGMFLDISRTFPGKFPEISGKFPGHVPDNFRKLPEISGKFPGHSRENFRTFP